MFFIKPKDVRTDVDALTEKEILEEYLDCSENTKEVLLLMFDELEYSSRRRVLEKLGWLPADLRQHFSIYEKYIDDLVDILNDGGSKKLLAVNSKVNIIFVHNFPENLKHKIQRIEKLPDVFRTELNGDVLEIILQVKIGQSQKIIHSLKKLHENYINLYLKKMLNNGINS